MRRWRVLLLRGGGVVQAALHQQKTMQGRKGVLPSLSLSPPFSPSSLLPSTLISFCCQLSLSPRLRCRHYFFRVNVGVWVCRRVRSGEGEEREGKRRNGLRVNFLYSTQDETTTAEWRKEQEEGPMGTVIAEREEAEDEGRGGGKGKAGEATSTTL